ncbi:hypothetical protein, partial [Vibrio harveyi]|uniref:hypothetical protein n=1 Tax=Vibrio harveyi TaxID=669 RepID=UPI003BB5886C
TGQPQQVEQTNSQVEQVTLQSEHVLGEGVELQQITEQTEVKQLQEFTHEEITNISPVSRVTEGGATSGSAEQPTSVETQAVEQPTSVETQAVEQPTSVETQAVEQPASVETQAVEQPTQTIVEKENGAINEQVVNDGQVTIVKKVGSDEDGEDLKDVERGLANSDLPPSERHKESEQGL